MKRSLPVLLAFLACVAPGLAEEPPAPQAVLGDPSWRHGSSVTRLAFSPDGQSLASAGGDRTVRVWDVSTGKERRRFGGYDKAVTSLRFSSDGRMLVTTEWNAVRLWEVSTGKGRAKAGDQGDWSPPVAVSPDGKVAAHRFSGRNDARFRISDVLTKKTLHELEGHSAAPTVMAFSPDGKTLATSSRDETIRLWDVASGKQTHRWSGGHDKGATALVFSPDGKRLASYGGEGGVRVWAAKGDKWDNVASTAAPLGYGPPLAFSPDGKTLALGEGGYVRLWDWQADKNVQRWLIAETFVHAVAFSPDGKTLAVGTADGPIGLWDPLTGKPKNRVTGHQQPVTALAYAPDGKTLATASPDNTVRFWDLATRKELRLIEGLSGRGTAVSFSGDGRLVASLRKDQRAAVWHADTAEESWSLAASEPKRRAVRPAFSPDGKTLAISHNDGVVRLYDAATKKELREFRGLRFAATALAFSPDGRRLAGYCTNSLRLWETAGKEARNLDLNSRHGFVSDLTFSPDGRLLAAVGGAGGSSIHLFETATGEVRFAASPHVNGIRAAAFSPDNRLLATGGTDGSFCFFELSGFALVRRVAHPGGVTSLAWSADGKQLATGGADALVRTWDAAKLLPAKRTASGTKLTADQLKGYWADLASPQAGKAGAAMRLLALSPEQAVELFRSRADLLTPARMKKLLADLSDSAFTTREEASAELERQGPATAGAIEKYLAGQPPAEGRRRAKALLARLKDGEKTKEVQAAELRAGRAVEFLDRLGTEEATKLLREWSDGEPQTELSRQAKDAVRRQERLGKNKG